MLSRSFFIKHQVEEKLHPPSQAGEKDTISIIYRSPYAQALMPDLAQSNVEYKVINQQVYNIQLMDRQIETTVQFVTKNPNQATISKYVALEHCFSDQECDTIETYFSKVKAMSGGVGGQSVHKATRDSTLRWLRLQEFPDSVWIYEKIMHHVAQVNAENWQFRLDGFQSALQLTEYEPGGHYTWHQDIGSRRSALRKLSVSVQLSDPDTYAGGGLELHATQTPVLMPRTRGTLIIFPSYTLHRVTAMSAGERRALVTWIGGLEAYQ